MKTSRCFCEMNCGPVVVLWRCRNGNSIPLCQVCVDAWLDQADDEPILEPLNLWWINNREAA